VTSHQVNPQLSNYRRLPVVDESTCPSDALINVQTQFPVRILSWSVKPGTHQGLSSLSSRCHRCGRLTKTSESDVYDLISYRKSWSQDASCDGESRPAARCSWHPADQRGNERTRNHSFLYNFGAWPVADRGLEVRPSTASRRLLPRSTATTPRDESTTGTDENRPYEDKALGVKVSNTLAVMSASEMIRTKRSNPDDPTLRRLGLIPVSSSGSFPDVRHRSAGSKRRSTMCDCDVSYRDTTLFRSPTAPEALYRLDVASKMASDTVRGSSSLPPPVRPDVAGTEMPMMTTKTKNKRSVWTTRTSSTDPWGAYDDGDGPPASGRISPPSMLVSKVRSKKSGLSRPGRLLGSSSTNTDTVSAMTELTGTRVPVNSPEPSDREGGGSGAGEMDGGSIDDETKVGSGSKRRSQIAGTKSGNAVIVNVAAELRREKTFRNQRVFVVDRSSEDTDRKSVELLTVRSLPMISRGTTAHEMMSAAVAASLSPADAAKVTNQTRQVSTCELVQWPEDINAGRSANNRPPTFDWVNPTIERHQRTVAAAVKPMRSITVVIPY